MDIFSFVIGKSIPKPTCIIVSRKHVWLQKYVRNRISEFWGMYKLKGDVVDVDLFSSSNRKTKILSPYNEINIF